MITIDKTSTHPIKAASDVVLVRQVVRAGTIQIGLGLVDQTKVVTAASELARNTLDYGKGGELLLEEISRDGKKGLRLTFSDRGPGIPDIDLALTDGFTSGGGLGMGLSGSKRLMSEFSILSKVGEGTTIIVTKWKP